MHKSILILIVLLTAGSPTAMASGCFEATEDLRSHASKLLDEATDRFVGLKPGWLDLLEEASAAGAATRQALHSCLDKEEEARARERLAAAGEKDSKDAYDKALAEAKKLNEENRHALSKKLTDSVLDEVASVHRAVLMEINRSMRSPDLGVKGGLDSLRSDGGASRAVLQDLSRAASKDGASADVGADYRELQNTADQKYRSQSPPENVYSPSRSEDRASAFAIAVGSVFRALQEGISNMPSARGGGSHKSVLDTLDGSNRGKCPCGESEACQHWHRCGTCNRAQKC